MFEQMFIIPPVILDKIDKSKQILPNFDTRLIFEWKNRTCSKIIIYNHWSKIIEQIYY